MTSPVSLRQRFAPALLAAALIPLAFTAHAAPGSENDSARPGDMPTALKARMEQRRQAVYDQAGIDKATQEKLNTAQQEHYEAMQQLRQDYRQRMQDILTDEQQKALQQAMRDVQREHMKQSQGTPGQ